MVEPVHEDRALFLEALDFTSAKTGFPTQLPGRAVEAVVAMAEAVR